MTAEVLTLGGFRPGSAYGILPGRKQLWWKPCLTRADGGNTHCWFLDATNEGTMYCHVCRVGRPRVYIGPRERVAEIKAALEAGDIARAQALAFGNAPLADPPPAATRRYLDRNDWLEWWTERAAVFEFLGGMSRAEAERAATDLAGTYP